MKFFALKHRKCKLFWLKTNVSLSVLQKIPARDRFNGKPVFSREPLTGKLEVNNRKIKCLWCFCLFSSLKPSGEVSVELCRCGVGFIESGGKASLWHLWDVCPELNLSGSLLSQAFARIRTPTTTLKFSALETVFDSFLFPNVKPEDQSIDVPVR